MCRVRNCPALPPCDGHVLRQTSVECRDVRHACSSLKTCAWPGSRRTKLRPIVQRYALAAEEVAHAKNVGGRPSAAGMIASPSCGVERVEVHDARRGRPSGTRRAAPARSRASAGCRRAAAPARRAGSRSAAARAAAAARRASAASPRTSPSRGTPPSPRAPARSRSSRSRSRCRTPARASPRARAAPRTPAARPPGGTRGGCPACSRRSSAGSTRSTRGSAPISSSSSAFVFFHVKYVYDCEKPAFASVVIIAGRVNASESRTTLGLDLPHLARSATPRTRTGFVCGLSTRKTRTPCATQYSIDVAQRLPQPAPVLGLEVDVVDVLVLLGRVLGVLERPVGAAVEPLGMLRQPRVVGRALDREVERDLDADLARRARRAARSRRACRGRDGSRCGRPPSPPIAHGLPTSPRFAVDRVVAALAVRDARSDGSAAGTRRRSRAPRAAAAPSRRPRSRPTSAGRARTTRRSARARASTSTPSFSVELDLAVPVVARSRRAPPRATRPSPSSARPSESSPSRSVCPPASLRRHLVLPRRDRGRSTPRRCTSSGPARRR